MHCCMACRCVDSLNALKHEALLWRERALQVVRQNSLFMRQQLLRSEVCGPVSRSGLLLALLALVWHASLAVHKVCHRARPCDAPPRCKPKRLWRCCASSSACSAPGPALTAVPCWPGVWLAGRYAGGPGYGGHGAGGPVGSGGCCWRHGQPASRQLPTLPPHRKPPPSDCGSPWCLCACCLACWACQGGGRVPIRVAHCVGAFSLRLTGAFKATPHLKPKQAC